MLNLFLLSLKFSKDTSSSEESEEEYVPDSCNSASSNETGSDDLKMSKNVVKKCGKLSEIRKSRGCTESLSTEEQQSEIDANSATHKKTCEQIEEEAVSEAQTEDTSVEIGTANKKNFCFICGKPQSKIARHLETHAKTSSEVAQVLALPKTSERRKKMLTKLRNRGNFKHNMKVLASGSGLIKVKRKSKKKYDKEKYVHCMYCQGLYLRKDLWRHAKNCLSKPAETDEHPGKKRVLSMATMVDSAQCQQISQGVWKLLTVLRDDDIASAVRSDFYILQLAQSFFNKHGQDPMKHEYIRQKIREVGRLLILLRKQYNIYNLEDAVRPQNFHILIQAVKKVSGFDEEKNSYKTPSLALKLGHSLYKIADIILCRSLISGDDTMKKSMQTFKQLYSSQWCELVSHTALTTLSDKHFNKPSTLPFTEDVQRLHRYLEKTADSATESLKTIPSSQTYRDLCQATLAKIILFNRRRGGEVSKIQMKAFLERDTTPLHSDVAVGLTTFEQKLCAHFSRVEIKGKRGRKVAVLLSPDVVEAITQLISLRQECGVPAENPYLFARPKCLTPYRGQDCLRLYAHECGAQKPELLRSTQLRKHVATLSQVLNLRNHELDQVADFLGHDIRVHREFYRLPEATTQLAKISKLLLAMEKGTLASLQGKSLEEIEIEGNSF